MENLPYDIDFDKYELPALDRTSDCETVFGKTNCRPEEYTYEELRTLNMGAKFADEKGNIPYAALHGAQVPEDLKILDLDTILDYLESQAKSRYIIEIKNEGEVGRRGLDILYQTVKERNLLDRVILGTFVEEVAKYKDEKYPDMMRGAYKKEVVDFYIASLLGKKDYEAKFNALQIPFNDLKEDTHVNVGTASVITDYPDMVYKIRETME